MTPEVSFCRAQGGVGGDFEAEDANNDRGLSRGTAEAARGVAPTKGPRLGCDLGGLARSRTPEVNILEAQFFSL